MPDDDDRLLVRSHVARDLLQTAGLFKNDRLVVWEYVSNGLQYVEAGTNPIVKVVLDTRRKKISIADNGRGMDWNGLKNFFVMHGENIDRKAGKAGRGRFGTGKSAAFGIANILRITTACAGKRSKVELTRNNVQSMNSGDEIPVRVIEREVAGSQENGTLIEIEEVGLRSLDQDGIIRYIERHLAKWPKNVTVFVNNHECEVAEPPVAFEKRVPAQGSFERALGAVELLIKASKAPLEEDFRGISIFSNGVWHETTLAGSEGREMAQYIFGEVDVPKLDADDSAISPFDQTRSMQLNANNELVRTIYAFINHEVEVVRRQLVESERSRKATEEAKRLARQATEIAKVINEDFADFRNRVAKARAKTRGGSDFFRPQPGGESDGDDLLPGTETPAEAAGPTGAGGSSGPAGGEATEPRPPSPPLLPGDPESPRTGKSAGAGERKPRPQGGGFQVKFDRMGAESYRAKYVPDERTIYLNLEHPQLAAAKGLGPVDEPSFRRLAYEIAFSEYAIALATELAQRDGYYIDPTDPIVDIHETLNRIARRAAHLYSSET